MCDACVLRVQPRLGFPTQQQYGIILARIIILSAHIEEVHTSLARRRRQVISTVDARVNPQICRIAVCVCVWCGVGCVFGWYVYATDGGRILSLGETRCQFCQPCELDRSCPLNSRIESTTSMKYNYGIDL